ncbi:MAG: hypothetical protein NTV34_11405 [Proteobacteria bacterium]|nr:hypothetical protein [Pseudomonadota bacterium]
MKLILLLCFLPILDACRSLYDKNNYVKAAASGAIGANEWKYGYAYTDPEAKLPDGIEVMIVLATRKPKNACPTPSDSVLDNREVVIGIDGKLGEMFIGGRTGEYETGDDLFTYNKSKRSGSVAFVEPANEKKKQYQFASSGKIKITKMTDALIEGFVVAKASPSLFVNGKFTAKICKWGQLN